MHSHAQNVLFHVHIEKDLLLNMCTCVYVSVHVFACMCVYGRTPRLYTHKYIHMHECIHIQTQQMHTLI